MKLQMSTVIGLGDLVEDEIIPPPIPMDINVENIRLTLIEDRPPVNITSPGSNPIHLNIGKMKISRDAFGVFHMQPVERELIDESSFGLDISLALQKKERDRELLSLQLVMQQLKIDNDSLKKQLSSVERNSESNR